MFKKQIRVMMAQPNEDMELELQTVDEAFNQCMKALKDFYSGRKITVIEEAVIDSDVNENIVIPYFIMRVEIEGDDPDVKE